MNAKHGEKLTRRRGEVETSDKARKVQQNPSLPPWNRYTQDHLKMRPKKPHFQTFKLSNTQTIKPFPDHQSPKQTPQKKGGLLEKRPPLTARCALCAAHLIPTASSPGSPPFGSFGGIRPMLLVIHIFFGFPALL